MAKYLTLNKQNPLFTHGWRLAPLFSSLSHHHQAQRHWASLVPRSNPQVSTCLSPPQELFLPGSLVTPHLERPRASSVFILLDFSAAFSYVGPVSFLPENLLGFFHGFPPTSLGATWQALPSPLATLQDGLHRAIFSAFSPSPPHLIRH